MPKLTKRFIDALEPMAGAPLIFDDEMPRFAVRVMGSGIKSYVIQYRAEGRTRRHTFGKVGLITPDEARDQARQLLAAVERGEDPSQERQDRRKAATVDVLCERFFDEHAEERCKPATRYEYRRTIDLFIKPALGSMKVPDVQRRHITELHHKHRAIPYQANRTLRVLSKMFNLAEVWGMRPDGSNPCRHVPKYKEEMRERFLSLEELARLGAVLDQAEETGSESAAAIAAFRLLILTGCRLMEIQTLKWDYIKGDRLALPDSKTGAKTVMLGLAAVKVLEGIPRIAGNPYVITGKVPGSHLGDLQHPWRRLRAKAKLTDVRIHDLRHSFASSAVGLGESLPMIGKLLGHSQVQTTARYAHLANDPVRSAADRISAEISRAMQLAPPA
jgi:integrase